ncbi:hypothetical protein ATK17_0005 [Branchiibius hedensis]|uniref:Uncharacterized protein n=1 Tax=Branchiibius hedensis TaxID=672460 RepID=A0A2Y9BLY4_9MICO|nr:hypothetical protein ATK17_3977 [Branchiibius hedensis]PWJ23924.1 hypothetical protein ATK17_0005 [Branchiibius hedensis]SSA32742.1 hypothetical protein SAMN04489750_0005 [Branchiibius hedensis]SSA59157.1 hypothetical protein SAMN04489750_3977 [Branchiibius hedensis]
MGGSGMTDVVLLLLLLALAIGTVWLLIEGKP